MIRAGLARLPAPVLVTSVVAVALAAVWLAAPPLGTDLSAQVARADFFAQHGWAPIDFRWYGGLAPYGYSLVSPPLMAWFGPRPVGAAAAVVSAVALALLLLRTGARRPLLGGVIGAACLFGNLVSGRVTFAVGIALGLLALLALAPAAGPAPAAPGRAPAPRLRLLGGRFSGGRFSGGRFSGGRTRYVGAGLLAALAAAASPVAGLFVGLAGTALLITTILGERQDPPNIGDRGQSRTVKRPRSPTLGGSWRWDAAAGLTLMIGAAVPMAAMAGLFGSGGWMNMTRSDMLHAAVASLAVAALVRPRVLRIGALLSAGGVAAAYLLTTPVGLNATRLAVMFTLPAVAAYATLPGWLPASLRRWPALWLVPVLVVLAWWQPPVLDEDLRRAGDPTASPAYFDPLRAELASRAPAGRVEVVPTVHYWESAYLDGVPLARGWLRQVDLGRNPLFFDGTLDAGSYRQWLTDNGVTYVALSNAELSWIGRREAELVRQGLPYLTPVWESADWTLYEVDGLPSILEGPAEPVRVSPDAVVFRATGAGKIELKLRWSRWLAVSGPAGACLAEAAGGWTTVRVAGPGDYRLTGSLAAPGPGC